MAAGLLGAAAREQGRSSSRVLTVSLLILADTELTGKVRIRVTAQPEWWGQWWHWAGD